MFGVIVNIGFVLRGGVNGIEEGCGEGVKGRLYRDIVKVFFNMYDFIIDCDVGM